MSLNGTRRTEFVESAFGHPGEYGYHRVRSVFLIHSREFDYFRAVFEESSVQKCVQEKYVSHLKGNGKLLAFVVEGYGRID